VDADWFALHPLLIEAENGTRRCSCSLASSTSALRQHSVAFLDADAAIAYQWREISVVVSTTVSR
jgi:hypothetical protein